MNRFFRFLSIYSKLISISIVFLTVVILFQNCSPVRFNSFLGDENPFTSKSNGANYGGKPSGDFYRFTPQFTCENRPAPTAALEIKNGNVKLTENKKLLCGATQQNLDSTLIDSSIYQNEVVGYLEGIYEGQDHSPTSIPANLVEVWCRDRKDEQGIETITHYDASNMRGTTRIHYSIQNLGQLSAQFIPDFAVARSVESLKVVVKDESGFEIDVFRDQPAPQIGLFRAQMKLNIGGKDLSRETFCRLGGEFDPNIWPAQQIVDFNVSEMKLATDLKSLAYKTLSNSGLGNFDLYFLNTNRLDQKRVGSEIVPSTNQARPTFSFAPNSTLLAFNTYSEFFGIGVDSQMKYTFSSQNLGDRPNIGIFKFSDDAQNLFYLQAVPGSPRHQQTLRSQSLATGSLSSLNPTLLTDSTSAGSFTISSTLNKVAFLFGEEFNKKLMTSDFNGSNLIELSSILDPNIWYIQALDPQVLPDQKSVQVSYRNKIDLTVLSRNFLVKIDGSSSFELPNDSSIYRFSPSGQFALLTGVSSINENRLLNLSTGQSFTINNLSVDPRMVVTQDKNGIFSSSTIDNHANFFSQDSSLFISPQWLKKSPAVKRAVAISTSSGTLIDLCSIARGDDVIIQEATLNQFLISTYESSLGILNLYLATKDGDCRRLASVATSNTQMEFGSLTLSSDQKSAAILLNLTGGKALGFDQVFYVPLNGRPAVLVNTPVFFGAGISYVFFSPTSDSLIYSGTQIQPQNSNVFRWELPVMK